MEWPDGVLRAVDQIGRGSSLSVMESASNDPGGAYDKESWPWLSSDNLKRLEGVEERAYLVPHTASPE